MQSAFGRISGMSVEQRAAVADAFSKASRTAAAEPVAVVGIGCRFPGNVTGPESFWDLLVDGRNTISGIPADRWDADAFYDPDPLTPGRMTTKWGGFLPDVAGFDADFFGITPREAAAMDPQQRIMLEVAWEALEDAGIPTNSLGGTRTGVMVGVYFNEYQSMLSTSPEHVDAYTGTGNSHSITVGRISYQLGLRGPAVAVDTACSSSLAAVHLACQSLRLRETDLALAGGVSLTLRPETQIAISSWGLLSPHGRCASFDAAADGFVRGEGAGVVVLKRLIDAVRDGDQVLAVVRGSAVNQDGRSNGITAPNTEAQTHVIADALRCGDLAPDSVDYVEAHGTGTALGDPIEFEALAATYGRGEGPCALGTVKTNLGHLEAAAGIAGLIKAVLAVQRGKIPRNLHFSQWNPAIDASSTRFFVPTENVPWPAGSGPRRAAVSSFGLGGTNAHVVIEQGPGATPVPAEHPAPAVSTLVVSGKSVQRVGATASGLADWMEGPGAEVALADVAHTLNHHRARQSTFATVAARDNAQAVAGLRALAAGEFAPGVAPCHEGSVGPGTVFVYSGRGSQWAGMGRQLLADEPAFAAAIDELEPEFVAQGGFSLRDVIAGGKELVGIEQIQLGLIGMQLALTALWRSYGVTPDAVIGHSMGEVAAAVVAGALTPAEGLRVTATRSRLMAPLSGKGGMALLDLGAEQTAALIADYPEVTLAIYNSPRQTAIAGPTAQIEAIIEAVRAQNRFASRVNIEVAPHNPAMDVLQPQMRSELADLTPRPPSIPIISTTYADLDADVVFDAEHWATNMRNPVRFQQGIAALGAEHHTFIEISAHPLLTHAVTDILGSANHHSVGTLLRDDDDTIVFHTNLNTTHTTRPPQTPHPPEPHPRIPTTPWQHTRHWFTNTAATHQRAGEVHTAVPQSPGSPAEETGRLFTLEWEPAPLADEAASLEGLLLVSERGDADPLLAGLRSALGERVGRCELVSADDEQQLREAISRSDVAWDGVVVVCPPRAVDEAQSEEAQLDLARQRTLLIAEVVKTISRVGARKPPRLWTVTRGAQQLDPADQVTLSQTQLRGMARVLAFEHPELKATMVDVEAEGTDSLAALTQELLASGGDDEVALRDGQRFVNRLVPVATGAPTADARRAVVSNDGGYIVVGGMGGLGFVVGKWLAEQGAGLVVLNGRSAPGEEVSAAIADLNTAGHRVEVVTGDIADPDTATRLVTAVEDAGFRVAGVLHSAMALADEIVLNMSEAAATTVFTPKVIGNWRLHQATVKRDLDWWLTFSSASSMIGSPGQGAYAAANSWVDSLVTYRRSQGLPAAGINWSPWAEVGRAQFFADLGLSMITTEEGLSAIESVLTADRPHTGVFTPDAWQWFQSFPALAGSSLFANLRDGTADDCGLWQSGGQATLPESKFRKSLRDSAPERRHELLFEHVRGLAGKVMGLPPTEALDPWTGFFQLGMDSLMSLTLARTLSESLGEFVPPSVVFDYPAVDTLTDYLTGILPEFNEMDEPRADEGHDEFTEAEYLQQLLERLK